MKTYEKYLINEMARYDYFSTIDNLKKEAEKLMVIMHQYNISSLERNVKKLQKDIDIIDEKVQKRVDWELKRKKQMAGAK